jgi:hypothetical protein
MAHLIGQQMSKRLAEFFAGAADVHAGGGFIAAKRGRDFGVGHLFNHTQVDRLSLLAGQQRDLVHDLLMRFVAGHGGVGRWSAVRQGEGKWGGLLTGSDTQPVYRTLKTHSQDQRRRVGMGKDAAAASPDVGERVLNRIFGIIRITQHAPGDGGQLSPDGVQMLVQVGCGHNAPSANINGGEGMNVYRNRTIM